MHTQFTVKEIAKIKFRAEEITVILEVRGKTCPTLKKTEQGEREQGRLMEGCSEKL